MKTLLSILTVTLALFVSGCNQDPSTPDVYPTFTFPTGSYWVYYNYTLDNNNVRVESSKTVDSVVVTGTKLLFGKTATILTHDSKGKTTDEYFVTDGNKLYGTTEFISPGADMPIPLDIPIDTWFLIGDYTQDEWTLFTQTFDKKDVSISGIDVKLTGTFKIYCKRMPSELVKWGVGEDKKINATKFERIYSFSGKVSKGILEYKLNFEIPANIWHSPNDGIVYSMRDTKTISVGSIYSRSIPGTENVMTNYFFNK